MKAAVRECMASKLSIDPELIQQWSQTLCRESVCGPSSLLYISSSEIKESVLPAFKFLGPPKENGFAPDFDIGRARLTLSKFVEAVKGAPTSRITGPVRADDTIPEQLRKNPELINFFPYSKRLLQEWEGRRPDYILATIAFPDNLCFSMLADLERRKLEVVSTIHGKLDYSQAKSWEDAVAWFILYQFSARVQPVRVISPKLKPELHLNSLLIALYLMLRLCYGVNFESASLTCTKFNLQRFVDAIQGRPDTESITVHSNLMFSN